MKRRMCAMLLAASLLGIPAAGAGAETVIQVHVDAKHQTLESFGTSGAWWAQYLGGWESEYQDTGRSVRDQVAMLLFDRANGIGLTAYRYNLGAGSAESGKGEYWNEYRRAQSFEAAPGVYDWSKDAQAVYMLKQAVAEGVDEVVLFCNSPLERLTENGMAQVSAGARHNIAPENYAAWATYVCDVAEHFVQMGIPVKFLSPINEPQWDWFSGQEGCHFEPQAIGQVYLTFLEELAKRPLLRDVRLSGPESGEWGGKTLAYVKALLKEDALKAHLDAIDCHSYWTDRQTKETFRRWMDGNHPDMKLRMSEWCEMVNGSDYGMDSALVLSKTIAEDLTVLDAVSWQSWVAVAPGGYHDGLIYALETNQSIVPLKRLWAYGNYSRHIRPGFTRVETSGGESLHAVAFEGSEDGAGKLVVVLVNDGLEARAIRLEGAFGRYESIVAYETSAQRDLEKVAERVSNTAFTLPAQSVTTIVFSE